MTGHRYTVDEINEAASRVIPVAFYDEMVANIVREGIYGDLYAVRHPLTRRQRVRFWFLDHAWRVRDAIAVLRGTHDCGGDY